MPLLSSFEYPDKDHSHLYDAAQLRAGVQETIMAELTLVSPSQRPIQPLVEGALQNELRLLEAGIRHSE